MTAPLTGTAARVDVTGKMIPLGLKASADQTITETDVKDPAKLTRLLVKMLADLAALRRRWAPRRIDFEDLQVASSGATVTVQHNLNCRVRWTVLGWSATGTNGWSLREYAPGITANTLVLQSYQTGVLTLRVEESG